MTHHMLDIRSEKYDSCRIESDNKHLTDEKCNLLQNLLSKYYFLFDRTLGTYKTKLVDIKF